MKKQRVTIIVEGGEARVAEYDTEMEVRIVDLDILDLDHCPVCDEPDMLLVDGLPTCERCGFQTGMSDQEIVKLEWLL